MPTSLGLTGGSSLSVLTATYNRAHTLPRTYESLRRQTFQDFEWIIVDDGSTDETAALVDTWRRASRFAIRYFSQSNQGKHVALGTGVQEAQGELIVPLDSDDSCLPHALERLWEVWHSIPASERNSFAGVVCRCIDDNGVRIGPPFPKPVFDSNAREVFYRFRFRSELWGACRTDVLREYPIPDDLSHTYLPEGFMWFRIAERFQSRYFDEGLRIYHTMDSGPSIMRTANVARNARGGRAVAKAMLRHDLGYIRYAPDVFLREAALYGQFSWHLGIPLSRQLSDLDRPLAKALVLATAPLAIWRFWRERSRSVDVAGAR